MLNETERNKDCTKFARESRTMKPKVCHCKWPEYAVRVEFGKLMNVQDSDWQELFDKIWSLRPL